MKRKHQEIDSEYTYFTVYQGTRSNNEQVITSLPSSPSSPELLVNAQKRKDVIWVSATKTYNAMMNNHLVDWLNLYGKELLNGKKDNDEFTNFLADQGIKFERKIYEHLSKNFEVKKVSDYYSAELVQKTLEYMKKGVQIIISAPLANNKTATYGIADLLIRSDVINDVFEYPENEKLMKDNDVEVSGKKLKQNFHYRVFDIKYSTLNLAANGKFILNNPKFNAYKSQLYIYNEALGHMQGYTPTETYIIGRKTIYRNNSVKHETKNSLERIGVINYNTNDKTIIQKTKEAVFWYRIIQRKGALWKIDPPSVLELYPNMCVCSGKWNSVKKDLAIKLGDVTLLWNCGIKQRENMYDNETYSFYSEKFKVEMLGLGKRNMDIVKNIIKVNFPDTKDRITKDNYVIVEPKSLIIPEKIEEESLQNNMIEYYVDFETFTDVCQNNNSVPEYKNFNMIFMIGVGWFEECIHVNYKRTSVTKHSATKHNLTEHTTKYEWKYKQFIARTPDHMGEFEIMKEFYDFIMKKSNVRLYHWKADEFFWKKAIERINNSSINFNFESFEWYDIMKIFLKHNIAINGVYDYGLKSIANGMLKHNMITTNLEAECSNGMMAMIKAWQCYQKYKNPIKAPIMKDIARYNQYDCKVMADILSYIRNNMLVN